MQKTYERINWKNEPSTKTPINEDNLNKIDYALDVVDTRVVGLYGYEERAKQSEENASASEELADTSATLSKSYAVGGTGTREGEDEDNSKYYSERAKEVANTLGTVLVQKGDVTFEELSEVDAKAGYMYKITEDFTSNETFADGGGKFYLAGTKVYLNADGLWELLTSTSGGGGGGVETNDIAIPLLLDDWVANDDGTYSQKVYVAGLSADANVIIVPSYVGSSLTKEELKAYNCLINDILIESGYITFKAKEIPSMSFTVVAQGTSATGDAVATVTNLVSKVDGLVAKNTELENEITELNRKLQGEDITCTVLGTPTTTDYPNGYECKKFGNLVTLNGDITVSASSLLNVPESIRPIHNKYSVGVIKISSNDNCFARIFKNGNISIQANNGSEVNGRVIFDISYTLD